MLKFVPSEDVSRAKRHLLLFKVEGEHALVLSLGEFIVLRRGVGVFELALEFTWRFDDRAVGEETIVAEIVVFDLCDTTIDVEECTILANELVSSDSVSIQSYLGS